MLYALASRLISLRGRFSTHLRRAAGENISLTQATFSHLEN